MPFAAVNGTSLHYHSTGEGFALLFIHPPLLNEENFNYQKAQLADDYRVVTFDIRGHGYSPYSPQPITYPLVTEDMKQLCDFLGIDKAIVCGYSTGGAIALEALLTYPDRFVGGVLISAMSEMTDWANASRISLACGLSAVGAKRLLGGMVGYGNADQSQTFHNLYKAAVQGDIRNIRQYYRYSKTYNCTWRLKSIKQPVLLVYGEKDTAFHRYADILHRELPNSELQIIRGVSHQIPTKKPRALHRAMNEWMDRHFRRGGEQSRTEAFLQDAPEFSPAAPLPADREDAAVPNA